VALSMRRGARQLEQRVHALEKERAYAWARYYEEQRDRERLEKAMLSLEQRLNLAKRKFDSVGKAIDSVADADTAKRIWARGLRRGRIILSRSV